MKTRIFLTLLTAALVCSAPWAVALVTLHGREPLAENNWPVGLGAIVNHPGRVCGSWGPIGRTARFHYSGGVAALNEILQNYAGLSQGTRVLYLHPEPAPGGKDFTAEEPHDFDLSITLQGEGFLHLFTMGRIKLEDLKVPDRVKVEVLPSVGMPIDAEKKTAWLAEQKRVEALAAGWNARQKGAGGEPRAK
jgi:hypothetical protein